MGAKYKEIAQQLRKDLANNLAQGISRLPTEKELCRQFQVSRQTVRQALLFLEQEHLITRKQGSGSYATGLLPDNAQNQIAVLLSSDTEYIYPALLGDLEAFLSKEGYVVSVFITHNRIGTERTILQSFLKTPPRGLIAEPSHSALPTPNAGLYQELSEKGCHIVFLHGCYPNTVSFPYVKDDNDTGGFLSGQFLAEKHHKQIAALFQIDTAQGLERYSGFLRFLIEAGLPINDDNIAWFTAEQLSRLEKRKDTGFLSDFIQRNLKSCSAVICHNDEIAYWLIKELSVHDIHVPEDISIVSFDNSYLSELSTPRLTSLSHKPHEMASAAVSLLIQKMQGKNVESVNLSWQLIVRNSTHDIP